MTVTQAPNVPNQSTLVIIKPDGVQRKLIGAIIARIEARDLTVSKIRMFVADETVIDEHYHDLLDREYYPRIRAWMTMDNLVTMIVSGPNAIAAMRQLIGSTNPIEATPGSIRADYATYTGSNLVHASDSEASATREILLWYPATRDHFGSV